MGERRPRARDDTPTPPSRERLEEAYRAVHNQVAFYQGLQTLDGALSTCLDATSTHEALVAQQDALRQEIATTQAALDTLTEQRAGEATQYAEQHQALEQQHQTYMGELAVAREAVEVDLKAARQELAQARHEQMQLRQRAQLDVQRAAASERMQQQQVVLGLKREAEALQGDVDRLTRQRHTLQQDIAAAVAKLGGGA
jgi:chromosome segregation ATPase